MRERVHGPFGLDAVREQTVRRQRMCGLSHGLAMCAAGISVWGIFYAAAFVVGALGVMCVTLSVIVVKRR
jgi:hypothetical protein